MQADENGRKGSRRPGCGVGRSAALEQLARAKREGRSLLSSYKVDEGEIFEEVDESVYNSIVQGRLAEANDFVVDDDGQGYMETGLEIWDQPYEGPYSSDEDQFLDGDENPSAKRLSTTKKAMRQKRLRPQGGTSNNLQRAFATAATTKASFSTPQLPEKNDQSNAIYQALLKEFDTEEDDGLQPSTFSNQRFDYHDSSALPVGQEAPPFMEFTEQDNYDQLMVCREEDFSFSDQTPEVANFANSSVKEETIKESSSDVHMMEEKPQHLNIKKAVTSSTCNRDKFIPLVTDQLSIGTRASLANIGMVSSSDTTPKGVSRIVEHTEAPELDGQDVGINFYWIDAFDRHNGSIVLIGKIAVAPGRFATATMTVKGIQRNLFVLPRQHDRVTGAPVTFTDLYTEISAVMSALRVSKFACKNVRRRYAFGIAGIPAEAEWLKLRYSFEDPAWTRRPDAREESRVIAHVFGATTPALELFIIKRRLMGPCWIRVANVRIQKRNASWVRWELETESPKSVTTLLEGALPPPSLRLISITLKSSLVEGERRSERRTSSEQTIVAAAIVAARTENELPLIEERFLVTVDNGVPSAPLPSGWRGERCANERSLCSFLLTLMQRLDPDVLVGHDLTTFDLPLLVGRLKALKIERWSRIGRLAFRTWPGSPNREERRRPPIVVDAPPSDPEDEEAIASTTMPRLIYGDVLAFAGRLLCDTRSGAKGIVKSRSFSLIELCQTMGISVDIMASHVPHHEPVRGSPPAGLLYELGTESEAALELAMRLRLLPLSLQLTAIAGNLWAHTLFNGARAERNEYLLLHEFHAAKFVLPDKYQGASASDVPDFEASKVGRGRRRAAYAGGLVLEPKAGLYDTFVILLDFNSLYPSIIQEHNICFTTANVEAPDAPNGADHGNGAAGKASDLSIQPEPQPSSVIGILPRILGTLVARRSAVKKLLQSCESTERAALDIRQQALKLAANSMYGCLGFTGSRFYAKSLAELVTAHGRTLLASTVELVEAMGELGGSSARCRVIYGDTDSIMIETGCTSLPEALRIGAAVRRSVNERHRLIEIDLEAVFARLLLLKKKKYAALRLNSLENVGPTTYRIETKGLDMVRRDWCGLSVETGNFVLQRIMSLTEGRDEVLGAIHEHLAVIGAQVREGRMPLDAFVIHKSLTKDPQAYGDPRAHPHVVVATQLQSRGIFLRAGDHVPFVICRSSGSNPSTLSGRAYHPDDVRRGGELTLDYEWYLQQQVLPPVVRLCKWLEGTDASRLSLALGLDIPRQVVRSSSHGEFESTSLLSLEGKNFEEITLSCPYCGGAVSSAENSLCNACVRAIPPLTRAAQIATSCRRAIGAFYMGWLRCDDPGCGARTRTISVYEKRCPIAGCCGTLLPEISDRSLYLQMLYWKKTVPTIETLVTRSAYPVVQLGELFRRLHAA